MDRKYDKLHTEQQYCWWKFYFIHVICFVQFSWLLRAVVAFLLIHNIVSKTKYITNKSFEWNLLPKKILRMRLKIFDFRLFIPIYFLSVLVAIIFFWKKWFNSATVPLSRYVLISLENRFCSLELQKMADSSAQITTKTKLSLIIEFWGIHK